MVSEEEKSFYFNGFSFHSDEINLFNEIFPKLNAIFPEVINIFILYISLIK
jgi:hypothetical protein